MTEALLIVSLICYFIFLGLSLFDAFWLKRRVNHLEWVHGFMKVFAALGDKK